LYFVLIEYNLLEKSILFVRHRLQTCASRCG